MSHGYSQISNLKGSACHSPKIWTLTITIDNFTGPAFIFVQTQTCDQQHSTGTMPVNHTARRATRSLEIIIRFPGKAQRPRQHHLSKSSPNHSLWCHMTGRSAAYFNLLKAAALIKLDRATAWPNRIGINSANWLDFISADEVKVVIKHSVTSFDMTRAFDSAAPVHKIVMQPWQVRTQKEILDRKLPIQCVATRFEERR